MITTTTKKTLFQKLFHNLCQVIPQGFAWHPPFLAYFFNLLLSMLHAYKQKPPIKAYAIRLRKRFQMAASLPPFSGGFSGNTLKWIAAVTMLLDHIGASVLLAYRAAHVFTPPLQLTYVILRDIGRSAFPIYIFLLVEGLQHTRNAARYFLRLCVFAILSEIPFDLAFYRTWYHPYAQNIYWTLAIGFFVIQGMHALHAQLITAPENTSASEHKTVPLQKNRTLVRVYLFLLDFGLILAGLFTARLLHTDYSYIGVLAIIAAYLLRRFPIPQTAAVCLILCLSSPREWYAFLALIPIAYYNGLRGRQHRWFFYLYYPVHLLLLYLIVRLLGLA